MNQTLHRPDRFFFGTRELPCPYLAGQMERKVVTNLSGANAPELYERLSRAGFRRSHGLAYRPACHGCRACIPVRIAASSFVANRSLRRVARANADLAIASVGALGTVEQYRLFLRYQRSRHGGGDMAAMSFNDYRSMVEETPVETRVIEFRDQDGTLIAVMLADHMADSYSAVYSFFDPDAHKRSLGTFMILWLIEQATAERLPHVYLGYWIEDSRKMAYKTRFRPLERLGPDGWTVIDETAAARRDDRSAA